MSDATYLVDGVEEGLGLQQVVAAGEARVRRVGQRDERLAHILQLVSQRRHLGRQQPVRRQAHVRGDLRHQGTQLRQPLLVRRQALLAHLHTSQTHVSVEDSHCWTSHC